MPEIRDLTTCRVLRSLIRNLYEAHSSLTIGMAQSQTEASSLSKTIEVRGLAVTPLTQCFHWHSERDIIAIRHKCCGEYYACISCHEGLTARDHQPEVWPKSEWQATKAVLCGSCRKELTVEEYMKCRNVCPGCSAQFNPGCALHYGLYFEV